MFTVDSLVLLSSFSHARLTKFAALLQKSTEIDVKKVTVKIIKLGKPEIAEAIQGMDHFIIICRKVSGQLQDLMKDIKNENGESGGNIFTFEEIDKAVLEPDAFGRSVCRQIGNQRN